MKSNKSSIIAFVLVVALMTILYICEHLYPFGDMTYLRMDFYHQYFPFTRQFYDTVHSGQSLLFSWQNGLGINFWPLFAYYLASPFNLILLLVPYKYLLEGMQVMLIVKGGAAAFNMVKALQLKYKHNDFYFVFFGAFYGLSAYFLSYTCNPIWLDMFLLCPLVMLGVERIANGESGKLYGITMGIATFSNFYLAVIGGMCCVLYFIYSLIGSKLTKFKEYMFAILKFVGITALYVLICAVILIPSAIAIMNVPDSNSVFPESISSFYSVLEGISRLLINNETVQSDSSLPNIFCSVCVITLLPLYFANKNISLRSKIPMAVLIVFMMVSFQINTLDYVWHGLHYPNCFPARQSFFLCFLLVSAGYECFTKRKHIPVWALIAFPITLVGLLIAGNIFLDFYEDPIAVYGLSALIVSLYMIVLILDRLIPKQFVFILFGCVALGELTCNTLVTGISSTVDREEYVEYFDEYEIIKDYLGRDFYRLEETERKTINDGALYGVNSASVFSSTISQGVKTYFESMGMRNSNVAYSYKGATPLSSSMLGINYVVTSTDFCPGNSYEKVELPGIEDSLTLWKNPDALSLGYMVDSGYEDYEYSENDNPFETYNHMAEKLLGVKGAKLFTPVVKEVPNAKMENTVAKGIKRVMEGTGPNVQPIMINIPAGEHIYIYTITYTSSIMLTTLVKNGEPAENVVDDLEYKQAIDLGVTDYDRTIVVTPRDKNIANINFLAYTMNESVYKKMIAVLKDNQLVIDEINNGHIKSHIVVKEDGNVLLTSIPYDPGWKVYVDGERIEVLSFKDAFIKLPLDSGNHKIEFRFIPKGFESGLLLSILGIIIAVAINAYAYRNNKKGE